MPQAIPAVIAAISYVGTATAAVVAGTATLAQIATVAAVGIGAGVGGMAAAKALTPQIGSQGAAVQWIADPDEPLRFAFGRVGVKGSIKDAAVYGPDRMYVSFACTVSAAGPIKSFVNFRAGDYYMSFDGGGKALNEPYKDEMWFATRLGAQPDTALPLPSGLKSGAAFPGWNSTRRFSGSAAYMVTLGENSKRSAYGGKIPAFVATIEGLYCYDPRLDSTYPGGSGTCRLNNPSTWVWTQNPILFALKWALGLWEGPTGKGAPQVDYQVGGIGAKPESILLHTVVEAANVAQANGWISAAWPSTDDDKAQVLDGFLKAGGAMYAEIAGKMAFIHRAAPRSPVFTVTARDTAGPVEIDTASSKLNRINTLRPRYWSEAHEWEMTALPEVTSTVWQEEDGQGVAVKRTRGADFSFVPQAKQARELASLEISHSREGIRGRVPLRPYMDPEPGNCFIFDEPDFALSNLKCFVLNVDDDTDDDTIVVTFETETDGKYPFAYGQTGNPPPAQELDPVDPTFVSPPLPDDWTIIVTPPVTVGGGQVPGFELNGGVSNSTATGVLVEWGSTSDGPWTQAYLGPPTVETIPITGVQPGGVYFIAVSYIRGQNTSERQVYGPYTAPEISADIAPDNPIWAQIRNSTGGVLQNAIDDLRGLFDEEDWREEFVRDLHDRLGLGFQIDPVARTALVRSETVFQGVGPGGLNETLIQTTTRLSAVDAVNAAATAQVLFDAKAFTNALRSDASLTYATQTGLGAAISAARGEWRSYADGAAAGAVVGLATNAALNTALATARGQWESYATAAAASAVVGLDTVAARESAIAAARGEWRSYADAASANAVVGLVTGAALATSLATAKGQWESFATAAAASAIIGLDTVAARQNALALAKGQWESYATAAAASATVGLVTGASLAGSLATAKGQWESFATAAAASATAGLDTVAARESAVAATVLQLKSYTDSAITTSTATLATQTTVNGVSATASLALSTANGNQAYAALMTDVNGRLTGMRVNGVDRSLEFVAEFFRVTPGGSAGLSLDAVNGVLKLSDASQKTLIKANGGIRFWSGPTSIADASITEDNGVIALGPSVTGGGRFNGVTLSGPFDSGEASASLGLTSTFQDVTTAVIKPVKGGFFAFWPQFFTQGNGTLDSGIGVYRLSIEYRIVSTNEAGSAVEVLDSGNIGRTSPSNPSFGAQGFAPSLAAGSSVPGAANGVRRIVLQARLAIGASAAVTNRRLRGFYAT